MSLTNLHLINFRNYSDLQLEVPSEGLVIEGCNGSGKTNLLESIYFLCTGRSQRGSKKKDLIKFDSDFSFIEASFLDNDSTIHNRSIGIGREKNIIMKIDGVSVDSIVEWFSKKPVVSFGPNDLSLVYGTPEDRRKFIDILGSQVFVDYLKNLISYKKALLNRNKLLQSSFDDTQMSIYESHMAEYGSEIMHRRKNLIDILIPFFLENYSIISNNDELVNLQYQLSLKHECSSKNECKNVFFSVLGENRIRDKECGFSTVGPHRDDVAIYFNNKNSKNFCSQGQCRSLVLSLKLASVCCIENSREEKMLFLIDDAVSELDSFRTSRVLPLLEKKGQIFVAVPHLDRNLLQNFVRLQIDKGAIESP